MASSQMPPTAIRRAAGFWRAWKKPAGKPLPPSLTLVEPSRSAAAMKKAPWLWRLSRSRTLPNWPRRVVSPPGLSSSSGGSSGLAHTLADRSRGAARRPRPVGARRSRRSREAAQARGQGLGDALVGLEQPPQQGQRLPEAGLQQVGVLAGVAALRARLAGRQPQVALAHEGLQGLVEAARAELVAGAVRGASLDAVLPALLGPVDDGGGLAVRQLDAPSAGPGRSLEVQAVGTTITFQSCR